MNRISLIMIVVALTAGVVLGLNMRADTNTHKQPDTVDSVTNGASTVQIDSQIEQRLTQLETQLDALITRIDQLETTLPATDFTPEENHNAGLPHSSFSSVADTPVTANARVLDAGHLVKAGIDPATAEDIVRRKNEIELQKLELRDRAAREGYLGSNRYMQELQDLMDADISLRAELGDDAYDRYLYTSGQANRVRVAAVMQGSAAEQAGLEAGDLILSYNDQRLFDWRSLQQATTEGSRDEFVSLNILRDGEPMLLWAPRGPLGVRLTMTRVNPDR